MRWKEHYEIQYREGIKTLITTLFVFAFISIVRVNVTVLERWINTYTYLEFLLYGVYFISIITVILTYLGLGGRTWRSKHRLFVLTGDFFAVAVSSGILLNYFSGMGFKSIDNGRILSFLFGCTSIMAIGWLIFSFHMALSILQKRKENTDKLADTIVRSSPKVMINRETDGSKEQDLLNRYPYAEKLKEHLLTVRTESYTIGILGAWGSGKSSFIAMTRKLLKEVNNSDYIIMDFTPWYFGDGNHIVLQKFLIQLSEEIRKNYGAFPKLNREIRQYAKLLSSVTFRPDSWSFSFKDSLESLFPGDEAKSLYSLKKDIEVSLKSLERNFIIFIDDLDRLDPNEIQTVLKLIRLVADFPNITYVLSLDEEIAAMSIQNLYTPGGHGEYEHGKKYLEKFIQLPIYLPKTNASSLFSLFTEGLEEIRGNLEIKDSLLFNDVLKELAPLDFSPRNIKRILFTYEFHLKILHDEVDKADLFRLTILKIIKPEIYEYIYQNKAFFTSTNNTLEAAKKGEFLAIRGYEPFKQLLVHLAPNSGRLYGDSNIKDNIVPGKKRLADKTYFERYFRNVLLDNEVSAHSINEFLNKIIELNDPGEQYACYEEYLKPYHIIDFHVELLNKISDLEQTRLLVIIELVSEKYKNIHESRTRHEQVYTSLSSCEVIIRASAKIVRGHLLSLQKFIQWPLKLWMDTLLFMHREELDVSQEQVIELLDARMSTITLPEMMSFAPGISFEMFQQIQQYSSFPNIKLMLGNWIQDEATLKSALTFLFDYNIIKSGEELHIIGNFTNILKYFPDQIILPLIRNQKNKLKLKNVTLKVFRKFLSSDQAMTEELLLELFLLLLQFSLDYTKEVLRDFYNNTIQSEGNYIPMNDNLQQILINLENFSSEHEIANVLDIQQ